MSRPDKRRPVPDAAQALRERIFAAEPGDQIGGLQELAKELEVGIVTLQQAARILEHEGLLDVRRGPGGGYFGRRPDSETLERALSAYLRSQSESSTEVLHITSLLFNELCAAAAKCEDEAHFIQLSQLAEEIAGCADELLIGPLEERLQNLLFRMVNRPFFELLTRVALQVAHSNYGLRAALGRGFGLDRWKNSRVVIIRAIVERDAELAHFEANRRNRQVVIQG